MAHKIKIKRVPYIRKDGTPSPTKKSFVVRCKCRHKVCMETEPFVTRREAEVIRDIHWQTVNQRRQFNPFPKRVVPVQYPVPVDTSAKVKVA
jgi:hypothetical protein